MNETSSNDITIHSLLDVNQASSEIISFFNQNSDSMPLVICSQRIIRYINPRLRSLLGYGWQSNLVNGQTTIDALVPPDFRAEHAELIARWFGYPQVLDMHSRGPIPIITADRKILRALIKLVPYEPREKSLRPVLDTPIFHQFGVAFITLLPRSWDRPHDTANDRPAIDPVSGIAGPDHRYPAHRGETGAGPHPPRGDAYPAPGGSQIDPALDAHPDWRDRPVEREGLDHGTRARVNAALRGLHQYGSG